MGVTILKSRDQLHHAINKLLILTMNSLYNVILVSTSKQSKLAKQVNSMVQIDRIEVLFEQNNYKWKNVMHPGC